MARSTKEEALTTREKLLDAAEHLFQAQGVSRTSLQHIAQRAGATRGAVYWHFKDKADLFNAMMERVTLPMEQSYGVGAEAASGSADAVEPLEQIRSATLLALQQIVSDGQTRRILEVATQKVEYVAELHAVRERHLSVRDGFVKRFELGLEQAARRTGHRLPVDASTAARGFHALIDGLIQNWLLAPGEFKLVDVGRSAMQVYLAGLGLGGPWEGSLQRSPCSAADRRQK